MSEQQQRNELAPADRFRIDVENASKHFLARLVPEDQLTQIAGRVSIAFRAVALKVPELYDLGREDVARAIALCALTGLMPAGPVPQVDLIPRWDKNLQRKTLNWQVTSRGWLALAERAGWDVGGFPVFLGETFDYRIRNGDEEVEYVPNWDVERTYETLRLFVVVARSRQAPARFRVIPKGKIEELRLASEKPTSGPWRDWPLEMAEKAAKAYACRRNLVPMSFEIVRDVLDPEAELVVEPLEPSGALVRAAPPAAPPTPARGPAGLDALLKGGEAPRDSGGGTDGGTYGHQAPKGTESVADPSAAERERVALYEEVLGMEDQYPEEAVRRARELSQIVRLQKAAPIEKLRSHRKNLVAALKQYHEVQGNVREEFTGWTDPGTPTGDELREALAMALDLAKEQGVDIEAAKKRAGCPAVDGAPESLLRRLLGELRDVVRV